MNAYLQFCLQPIYRRAVDGPNWVMRGLSIALCLIAPVSIASGVNWRVAWMAGVVVPFGMLGIMWWVNFMTSVLLQCTPALVLTTPTLQRRMRLATVAMWAALSAAFAGLLAVVSGHFLATFIATGLVLLAFVALMLAAWLGLVGLVVFVAVTRLAPAWLQPPAIGAGSSSGLAWLGAGLLFGLGWVQLRCLFPSRARGLRRRAGMNFWSHSSADRLTTFSALKRCGNVSPLLRPSLRRACLSRQPGRLLMHGLGPRFYSYHWLWPTIPMLLMLAVIGHGYHRQVDLIYWIVLFGMQMSIGPQNVAAAISHTRGEQALLRLAPGMPQGVAMNRLLAGQLMGWFLSRWLVVSACMVLMVRWNGAGWHDALLALAPCAAFLMLAGTLLQDYARSGKTGHVLHFALWQCALMGIMCVFARTALPWLWCGMACVLAATVHGALRWRMMVAAAPAFPAGRS